MAALVVAAVLARLLNPPKPYPRPLHRAAVACAEHWVGAWATSQSGVSQTRSLSDQTLRMIVAPHLSGSTIRVRLSNRYGDAPVTLGPVTVGLQGSGPALAPGSERPVTFGGARTVAVAPGADAVSDPIRLAIAPFGDLAVSVFVPGTVAHPDEHLITRQTSYLSPRGSGDESAQADGSAFTRTTTGRFSTGWYFLDGVDVEAPGRTGAVVAFGDSLTDGYQPDLAHAREQLGSVDTNTRYPDDLARRLIAAGIPLSVLNAGVSGDQLLSSGLPQFGAAGLARFGPDVLDEPGVTDVIVLMGINDIAHGASAGALIGGYEELIDRAHADGVAIQLGTLTPTHGNPGYATTAATSARAEVNQWIRAQHYSDGIVDFDAAVRDPSNPGTIKPAYDGGDELHLNSAGNQALARAVDLAQLARPDCR